MNGKAKKSGKWIEGLGKGERCMRRAKKSGEYRKVRKREKGQWEGSRRAVNGLNG